MPMGIVSDSEFDSELGKIKPSTPHIQPKPITGVVLEIERGRKEGSIETPDSLRKLVGETAITDGREAALKLGQAFGLSPSSVSAYSVGATSTASYAERPNNPIISSSKSKIASKARGKLMMALKHLTEEKLVDVKARDIAAIAKDMSVITRNMEDESPLPTNGQNGHGGVQFIVYQPTVRQENHYEVIYSKE